MKFENKVAIVTGAGGGIGRAIALALAKEGADLVLNDIALEPMNKVAEEIKTVGSKVMAERADVTNSIEIRQMVKNTLVKFGGVDILINVAGGSGRKRGYFHEIPDDVWGPVIDLNLKGTLVCCHAVIEHMIQKGRGKIINIASVAGMIGSSVGMTPYSAAKAGVIGFTKSLAKELAPFGINVNCVSPGPTATQLLLRHGEETAKKLGTLNYLKRLGKPEEIANVVVFLASDEASYIVGQNYAVCGGRSLGW
jgi:NAD(P)-dependent dehydrogenase (short-subunit alcohol dehydrogenase family)